MVDLDEAAAAREFPRPDAATNAPEFVAEMRALRSWAALTYRQVEARAATNGEVLPYSTLATALRRDTLPRRELLGVFVRSCGGDAENVARWQAHRDRLAVVSRSNPGASGGDAESVDFAAPSRPVLHDTTTPPGHSDDNAGTAPIPAPSRTSRVRRPRPAATIVGVTVCVWLALFLVREPDLTRLEPYPFTIETAHDTCLDTRGRDATGNPVVVEAPCEEEALAGQLFAQRNVTGSSHIKTRNPDTDASTWCVDLGARNQLRPNKCAENSRNQLFEMEAVRGAYRIRPVYADRCFGLAHVAPNQPRQVVAMECSNSANQLFTPVPL